MKSTESSSSPNAAESLREPKRLIRQKYGGSPLWQYIEFHETKTGYWLSTHIPDPDSINVTIDIDDGLAVLHYSYDDYDITSELAPTDQADVASLMRTTFEIFEALVENGATLIDKFVGDTLVSSRLVIDGAENTHTFRGFKIFGKRRKKTTIYKPLREAAENCKNYGKSHEKN